jgi:phosphorylcholine metabolism protein LicD
MSFDNFSTQSDTKGLSKAIIDVNNVAKKNNLHIWLNCGALLGIIRENRLLPWNNDAHLCCKYEENISEKCIQIVRELDKKGYRAYYYPTAGTVNIKKRGVDVNINIEWLENKNYVRPHEEAEQYKKGRLVSHVLYWLARSMSIYTPKISLKKFIDANTKEKIKILLIIKNKFIPKKLRKLIFEELIKLSKNGSVAYQKKAIPDHFYKDFYSIDFYGDKISIPKKSSELMEYIYGKEWKIPMSNWSFYDEKNKSISSIEYIDESWDYKSLDFI